MQNRAGPMIAAAMSRCRRSAYLHIAAINYLSRNSKFMSLHVCIGRDTDDWVLECSAVRVSFCACAYDFLANIVCTFFISRVADNGYSYINHLRLFTFIRALELADRKLIGFAISNPLGYQYFQLFVYFIIQLSQNTDNTKFLALYTYVYIFFS